MDLILLNLMDEFEKREMMAALINRRTARVGMSFKPHKKV